MLVDPAGPVPAAVALPPGTQIGAFQIVRHIASGGMGSVYEARNRITGEARALKVMLPQLAAQPEFVNRFVREIRLMISVAHPNLVRVYEPGMEGTLVFLPMELLQGETLSARLKREGRISISEAVQLVLTVGLAVAMLHDRGILHRDLKPSNVFLARTPDGAMVPKVLDLGAARTVVEHPEEATVAGTTIGSPHYMSFEQAAGRKDLDGRVDEYALAVILYQMITGTRPYENDDTGHAFAKVLAGIPYRRPRELNPEVPPKLEVAVLRAMARDRDQRFGTLREFLTAIAQATGFELLQPPAPGDTSGSAKVAVVSARIQPKSRTGEILAIAIAGVAFVGLVIAAVFAFKFGMSSAAKASAAPPPQPTMTATATTATAAATATATATTTTTHVAATNEPTVDIGDLPTIATATATATASTAPSTTATATATTTHHAAPPKCVPKPGVPCL